MRWTYLTSAGSSGCGEHPAVVWGVPWADTGHLPQGTPRFWGEGCPVTSLDTAETCLCFVCAGASVVSCAKCAVQHWVLLGWGRSGSSLGAGVQIHSCVCAVELFAVNLTKAGG